MSEEKTFKEEIQPILDSLKRREEIAHQLAGKNLIEGCQVFRLPLPSEVWKFDDPSTHNIKRGPDYLFILVRQEGDESLVVDDGGCGGGCKCHRKTQELSLLPTNELVNSEDYVSATIKDSEKPL